MDLDQLTQKQDLVREGDICDYLGRFEEAISFYDKALQIDPTDADALFDKGMTLQKMGKRKEALRCIAEAVNLYCDK